MINSYVDSENAWSDTKNLKYTIGKFDRIGKYIYYVNGEEFEGTSPLNFSYVIAEMQIGKYFLVKVNVKKPKYSHLMLSYRVPDSLLYKPYKVWDTIPSYIPKTNIFHKTLP